MSKKTALSLLIVAAVGCAPVVAALAQAEQAKDAPATQEHKAQRPRMDLAFCIDTTGSMGNEIEMVKTKVKQIVSKLASGKPAPDIRVGLVAYRDRGDEYVTKVFQFSDDIDKVVRDISSLSANGGGDAPEAVNEGLHAALHNLQWDKDKKAAKLLFLIGDAGPHQYPGDFNWKNESRDAIGRGIQINTIACQGMEASSEWIGTWKQIAKLSDGKYDTLAYRQEIVDGEGKKETIVTAGGEAFRLKAGAAKPWKEAVSSGMVDKVAMPMAAAAPSMTMGRAVGGKLMRSPAEGFYAGAAGGSRSDSNLDELVLEAAKKKAEKNLNVEYRK